VADEYLTLLDDLFGAAPGDMSATPGIDWGSLFSGSGNFIDPGLAAAEAGIGLGAGEPIFYDTVTRSYVTLSEAMALDPTFNWTGPSTTYSNPNVPMYPGDPNLDAQASMSGSPAFSFGDALAKMLGVAPSLLKTAGALGLLGGAGAAIFGGGNQPGTSLMTSSVSPTTNTQSSIPVTNVQSTQPVTNVTSTLPVTNTSGTGPTWSSQQTAPVYNTSGTGPTWSSYVTNPTSTSFYTDPTSTSFYTNPTSSNFWTAPTTTTQSTTPAMLANPLTQSLLGMIPGALPQLNPEIQAALNRNALAMSQGQVPTLQDQQALDYFNNILQGQQAAVDYNAQNAMQDMIRSMQARGFSGGLDILREGAPAAAAGPLLAQANAQKAMNLGNINAQQLAYATQLPQTAAALYAQQLAAQGVPYNAILAAVNQLLTAGGTNTVGTTSGTSGGQTTSGTSGGQTTSGTSGGQMTSGTSGMQMTGGTSAYQNLGPTSALGTTSGTSAFQNLGPTGTTQNLGGTATTQNLGATGTTQTLGGRTTTGSETGATPSLLSTLTGVLPLISASGSLLGSPQMTGVTPQQQQAAAAAQFFKMFGMG